MFDFERDDLASMTGAGMKERHLYLHVRGIIINRRYIN